MACFVASKGQMVLQLHSCLLSLHVGYANVCLLLQLLTWELFGCFMFLEEETAYTLVFLIKSPLIFYVMKCRGHVGCQRERMTTDVVSEWVKRNTFKWFSM